MQENAEEDAARKRRRGTRGGLLMIAFGIISAFFVYFSDSNSMDFTRMMNATYFAVVHAVLWSVAGLIMIGWYNRPLDHSPPVDMPDRNDPARRAD